MPRATYVFPHVPKCGGTSIQKQISSLPLNLFLDYEHPPGNSGWAAKQCERRNREFSFLDFSPFDLVFGHFPVERYASPAFRYIALVRDPYERFLSQLNFLVARREQQNIRVGISQAAGQLLSGGLDIVTWFRQGGFHSIYKLYLGYWPRERFDLVGTTHAYGEFVGKLNDRLGVEIDAGVAERKAAAPTIEVPPDQEKRIRYLLRREYEWYREFAGE